MGSPGSILHCPKNLCRLAVSGAEGKGFSGKHISWPPTRVLRLFQNTLFPHETCDGEGWAIPETPGHKRKGRHWMRTERLGVGAGQPSASRCRSNLHHRKKQEGGIHCPHPSCEAHGPPNSLACPLLVHYASTKAKVVYIQTYLLKS